MTFVEATCSAPVNIAVIKYWGKRDTALILPTNSSLSLTLSQDDLRSTTSIRADATFTRDALWLNGSSVALDGEGRMTTCLEEMRKLRRQLEQSASQKDIDGKALSSCHLHIVSENNFPTAAGLASSASGFAALVFTLAKLYQLPENASELSRIARQGSGSACRSLFGGYVAWEMGASADGQDSLAVQVAPETHWAGMKALICVVSDAKKGTSSTSGMQRTVQTSTLLQERINSVVPERMAEITKAINQRDFDTFATITMKDSNSFHAVCMDTFPPIFYLNDVSRSIIAVITELNRLSTEAGKGLVAAYTFDAGPNAVIYALEQSMPEIIALVSHFFPGKDRKEGSLPAGFNVKVSTVFPPESVSRLIHTRVGDGPRVLSADHSLVASDGQPKRIA
ncbi:uncharacterized protein L969DRAFT_89421 [Mixia osmundae IAM 14324]|uniref:Diphosphomevalonate decarboxylase n=1 Tax=Mixia osmundae (strain CBS 9802 / IAM 14324 / JCM 22182 / KY 12970) TaxID=764103 RepID=G7DWR5_MIXOS|nr:uncharacterized protein L969DRAFT_91202 [Mixia osmundae IAM 14324]XP_014566735.1 uncharacterized protein L969DRAFT_89421 [Mixia osmundae IAM 14324]KEI36210.1 hypothetical protein L969DRAFT_91202 [Mixia osmundae IAM 14324]KEI38178.1 hypothetical protein L969DRAFT_89421 [Mixia osmundae IAM 14324]GAA95012.1 hypothetical protein E5Q_01667 [Mixia osmundae IAM 14324]